MNIICKKIGADATGLVMDFLDENKKNYSEVMHQLEDLVEILSYMFGEGREDYDFTPSDIKTCGYCHVCSKKSVTFFCVICCGAICAECQHICDGCEVCNNIDSSICEFCYDQNKDKSVDSSDENCTSSGPESDNNY